MKRNFIINILVSGALGALIWFCSPYVTGMVEPWDSETPYYFTCLFIAGFITGAICPRHIWAAFLGIVIGQLLYIFIFIPLGPLIVIGIPVMFALALLALVGIFLGTRIRCFLKGYMAGANNRA